MAAEALLLMATLYSTQLAARHHGWKRLAVRKNFAVRGFLSGVTFLVKFAAVQGGLFA